MSAIRKAKRQTRNARKRKRAENYSNADRLNPVIWEAKRRALLRTKEAFREAKWYADYNETKRMLALSLKHESQKANN